MNANAEISHWWKLLPALPCSRDTQEYHALRRVWGDHTIAAARSFYRWGTEDNVTPALFQSWCIFDDPDVFRPLLEAAGLEVAGLESARWAYACEEEVLPGQNITTAGKFVIPDIVLHFQDEAGAGVVAFEVKKPGKTIERRDVEKLGAYVDLPSIAKFERRAGCFIVSERCRTRACALAQGYPVITWEDLLRMQQDALDASLQNSEERSLAGAWLERNFSRCGVGYSVAPVSSGKEPSIYGTADAYACISDMPVSESLKRFLKGSECVEAAYRGDRADPPLDWLQDEISVETLRLRKLQSTRDRRIRRWSPDWNLSLETPAP
ncbi:hypothetical protein [Silicimonas sp. MF1-12-2]|uniref:hypothetical protein n=1 Tax=Silicimonas sp. MF1-12-2 TaxID=3384793 RepID=UPI0039B54E44